MGEFTLGNRSVDEPHTRRKKGSLGFLFKEIQHIIRCSVCIKGVACGIHAKFARFLETQKKPTHPEDSEVNKPHGGTAQNVLNWHGRKYGLHRTNSRTNSKSSKRDAREHQPGLTGQVRFFVIVFVFWNEKTQPRNDKSTTPSLPSTLKTGTAENLTNS